MTSASGSTRATPRAAGILHLADFERGDTDLRLALDAAGMGTFVWHLGQQRAQPDARTLELLGLSDRDPSVRSATWCG